MTLKLSLVFIILAATNNLRADVQYQITNIGTLGGASSFAYAINSNGQVVGSSQTAGGDPHAFLFSNGIMSDLGTLGGSTSVAYGINNNGQVVGNSDIGAMSHAFLYNGNDMKDLTPGSGYSSARAINSTGQIAGSIDNTQGANSFIYTNGNLMQIDPLSGDTWASAYAINANGQIVGLSLNANAPSSAIHAFNDNEGNMINIDTSTPFDVFASAINDSGDIVGETSGTAFLYSNSVMTDLGTLGGISSGALGVNASGVIVGSSETPDFTTDAFLVSDGTNDDNNPLIDTKLGWHLEYATAINDSGQIVGYGEDSFTDGGIRGFIFSPTLESASFSTPEPSCVGILALSAILAMRSRRPVHKYI